MRINYFGKPYSFSHVAALRRFGKKHDYNSHFTIVDTIDSIIADRDSIGIVPIENTTGGVIYDTVDTLCMGKNKDLLVREELELSISLFLSAKDSMELSQIKTVYSHEYALKRSEGWVKQYIPQATVKKVTSTSDAACRALEEKDSCAICSIEAAKYYGLKKIAEILVEGKKNLTRFFILGNAITTMNIPKKNDYRTTLVLELKDRIGALCDGLGPFKKHKISMTRIISMPDKKEWAYIFFIEIKGQEKDQKVKKALNELKKHVLDIRVLGSYPLITL